MYRVRSTNPRPGLPTKFRSTSVVMVYSTTSFFPSNVCSSLKATYLQAIAVDSFPLFAMSAATQHRTTMATLAHSSSCWFSSSYNLLIFWLDLQPRFGQQTPSSSPTSGAPTHRRRAQESVVRLPKNAPELGLPASGPVFRRPVSYPNSVSKYGSTTEHVRPTSANFIWAVSANPRSTFNSTTHKYSQWPEDYDRDALNIN
jgi:hypothetical protein